MPNLLVPFRGRARVAVLAAPVVFLGAIFGGCGYQLQLEPTPTATPGAVSLGVHQIAGRQPLSQSDTQSAGQTPQLQQLFDSALGSSATQPATQDAPALAAPQTVAFAPAAAAAPVAAVQVGGVSASLPRLAAAPADSSAAGPVSQPASAPTAAPAPGGPAVATAQPAQPHATVTDAASNRSVVLPAVTSAATAVPAASTARPSSASLPVPPAPPTRPPAIAARTAVPTTTPRPPVVVALHPGENEFAYAGATTTIDHALASIAGTYTVAYYEPVGTSQFLVYRPGIDPPLTVTTGSELRIMVKPGVVVNFTMYPPL